MPKSYGKMDDTDPLAASESLVFKLRHFLSYLLQVEVIGVDGKVRGFSVA